MLSVLSPQAECECPAPAQKAIYMAALDQSIKSTGEKGRGVPIPNAKTPAQTLSPGKKQGAAAEHTSNSDLVSKSVCMGKCIQKLGACTGHIYTIHNPTPQ